MDVVVNRLNKCQGTIGFHLHSASPECRHKEQFRLSGLPMRWSRTYCIGNSRADAACILWFQGRMIDLALPLGQKVKS
jgi:hypothetical protein